MYRKILVPIDGSATSLKGLHEAIKLGKALKAKLKLVHVINELLGGQTVAPSVYHAQIIDGERAAGRKTLADAQTFARQLDAEVAVEMIETIGARASSIIIEAATRWNADLIVMGTHGRKGLQRLALGSDAELVLRSAPVPVLMVREVT